MKKSADANDSNVDVSVRCFVDQTIEDFRGCGWHEIIDYMGSEYLRHIDIMLQKVPAHCLRPRMDRITRMFRIMEPKDIRVVIMSQEPYSSTCPNTNEHLAYGIAFYTNPKVYIVPATLKAIGEELSRCFPNAPRMGNYNSILEKWMSQGVFLANRSLTLATDCDNHLRDHSVVWERFSREFLRYLSSFNSDILFVLMGSKAWELETSIPPTSVCIKTPHPVSRGGEFIGCDIFNNVNKLIRSDPIEW